jgi:hypothetical protein
MFAAPLPLPRTLVVPSRSANKRTHATFKRSRQKRAVDPPQCSSARLRRCSRSFGLQTLSATQTTTRTPVSAGRQGQVAGDCLRFAYVVYRECKWRVMERKAFSMLQIWSSTVPLFGAGLRSACDT